MAAEETGPIDRPTVVAIALVAYALVNVAHEALGHGGACVLSGGGAPLLLNAIYFSCDESGLGPTAVRWIAAGGTLVNLLLGISFGIAFASLRSLSPHARYFLWLVMVLNLFQATGYWLFSGLGGIADWAEVTRGFRPSWLWRVALVGMGTNGYYLAIQLALRTLSPLLGGGDARERSARTVTVLPYVCGGLMYLAAGALNPESPWLVLISAAAASLGGTSALAWMTGMLRDARRYPVPETPQLVLTRSLPWIVTGGAVASVFVLILGRTVRL